jgi:RNA polymerase sigma-70 factor (ECF subfamily)
MAPSDGSLQTQVERIGVVGLRAWPTLAVDGSVLASYVRQRFKDGEQVPDDLFADIYLACACLHGAPGAISAFMTRHLADVERRTRSFNSSPSFADDVRQKTLETLFLSVGDDPAKIAQYEARGPLGRWVRVVVRRVALRLASQSGKEPPIPIEDQILETDIVKPNGGEARLMATELKSALRKAFVTALHSLSVADRLLLKMCFAKKLTMTVIARINRVSQPTISRKIEQARCKLIEGTHQELAQALGLNDMDLRSMFRMVRSQIEVSLTRLLAEEDSGSLSEP